MKKTYITPEMEIVRISPMNIIATSGEVSGEITEENKEEIEYNSNSFRGGALWEED
ncbi:MAG: hypothetical protein ACI4TR_00465 [Bacteroidaceae bacterium]